jgi:N-acetyl-anhydromuramyl-L-alanine amidase AmpD
MTTTITDGSPTEVQESNSSWLNNSQLSFRFIEWKGSPNFWSGRNGQTATAICDHIMEGTMDATNSWFKNLRSEASSHFGVAKDGRIWQWVKVEDTAWGNGILQSPDMSVPWLAECARQDINPNYRTISIEHEGSSGDTFTESQYQATLWLHRYLCALYSIPADRQHIVGHYQVMSRDRANCPGPSFPWQRLMTDLAQTAGLSGSGSSGSASSARWTDGVSGVVLAEFGPGVVNSNNSFVRKRPSLSSQNGTLLRTFNKGKTLRFSGYTDAGPAFQGQPRWYLISDNDGGGWIHSRMITLK